MVGLANSKNDAVVSIRSWSLATPTIDWVGEAAVSIKYGKFPPPSNRETIASECNVLQLNMLNKKVLFADVRGGISCAG